MMRAGGVTTPGGNYSTGTTVAGASGGVAGAGGTMRDVWRALGFLSAHRRAVVTAYAAWIVANLLDLTIPLKVQ